MADSVRFVLEATTRDRFLIEMLVRTFVSNTLTFNRRRIVLFSGSVINNFVKQRGYRMVYVWYHRFVYRRLGRTMIAYRYY